MLGPAGRVPLWSNRNFRRLLAGSAVVNLGDGVAGVAMPWLATLLTRDPLAVSAVATAAYLPWLLFTLPVGVITDRADRRRLMLRADGARLVLTLGLVAMTLSLPREPLGGAGPIALLAAIAFLLGTAAVVRGNAAQTLTPSIVDHTALERANGQIWSAEQVTGRFIGPPLAGALIAAGIVVPFGFNAATLAVAIGLIWLIAVPVRPAPERQRFAAALRDGVRWMRDHPVILRLAVILGAINAVSVGGMTILVLYAQDVLHLGATGYGALLSAAAVGGTLGGLVAPDVARRLGPRATLIVCLAIFVVLHLVLGLLSSVVAAALAIFAEAAGGMLWNVVTVSYRQRLIPDALLGRVNAIYRFFAWGVMPFGALAAGATVTALEPSLGRTAALHAPFLAGALICGALLAYGVRRLRFER